VASAGEEVLPEIVVTSFRNSLMKSQTIKQESTSIVEALTAEDIGKLPDNSIAESLGRIPGLAAERVDGRTSGLSVRGFKEDFVGTTLNGRELLGIGDNRGVEFDLYPAEIMSGAVVYKSPEATLSAMGIGGTVDLRTARPLDVSRNLTLTATGEKNGLQSDNPDYSNTGHRYALAYTDHTDDNKIGLALVLASTNSPKQAQENGVWGWNQNSSFGNAWAPSGIQIFSHSSVLKRDTGSVALEFRPSSDIDVTLDALAINFTDKGIKRGFIEALNNASLVTANGVAVSGTTSGFNSVIRSDPTNKTGTLRTFGVNLKFKANEHWTTKFDMAHSQTSKSDEEDESYAGVGRAGTTTSAQATIRNWTTTSNGLIFNNTNTNFADFNTIKLAGPQSWGGSLAPITSLAATSAHPTVGFAQAQDGFMNQAIFSEHLNTVRLEGVRKIDGSWFNSLDIGLQYSDHRKSKDNYGAFLTANTWPADGLIPAWARVGTANLNWAGLGSVVAYDAQGLINSPFYTRWDARQLEPDRMGDTYVVSESVTTLLAKADFNGNYSGVNLYGNVGAQLVNTNQNSTGYSAQTGSNLFVQATPVAGGDKYNKFLPSLNVNADWTNGQVTRFALSKAMSRARIDYLKPGGSVKFQNNVANVTSTNPATGPWLSNSGNPTLRPYEANQVDVNHEWYFAKDGFVSVGAYYKDLTNWSVAGANLVDFHQYYIPGYHQAVSATVPPVVYTPATFLGYNTTYTDGLKGKTNGLEAQLTMPLRLVTPMLDGFGFVASASLNNGGLDNNSRVPGLSKDTQQLTMYYEGHGFGVRVAGTHRTDYLSEQRGGSNTLTPVNRQALTLVDAQISYDFAEWSYQHLKGLRVALQMQNLTNQDDVDRDNVSGQIINHNHYGTNYLLTLKYTM
jgi:iron complex outermembrane receptor protein